jgi:hypothetical protein
VDGIAAFIGVAIFFGLVFGLGEWMFRRLADRLDSRLQGGWRWLTLPVAAFLCFAGFVALRPFILEQPRTPLWFLIGVIGIALLIAGTYASAYAAVALGKWFVAALRSR